MNIDKDKFYDRFYVLLNEYKKNNPKKTYADIADDIGISRQTLYRYYKKQYKPDLGVVYKMANFFNVSTDYLAGFIDYDDDLKVLLDIKSDLHNKFKDFFIILDYIFNTNLKFDKEKITIEYSLTKNGITYKFTFNELMKITNSLRNTLDNILESKRGY